jgi:peptidoglycan/xylan/chitin deacetylase (PgdA/CDA1 family)
MALHLPRQIQVNRSRRWKRQAVTFSRHDLFAAGFRAIAASGADRWLGPVARGAGVILTFHHVRPVAFGEFAPNRLLEITPDFLDLTLRTIKTKGFDLVPLDEVPARIGRKDGPPFAVLTFDDGYRDNVEHAAPILRHHRAPWTLFVTTDFADGRGRLWWLELEAAIARLDRVRVGFDGEALDLPSRTAAEKQRAFAAVYWRLRAGPEDALREQIGRLAESAGVDSAKLVRSLCLGWDEIAVLARDPAVTIGAHTLTHPMLAKHGEEMARREMAESKAILEQRLGRTVRHLAYPVGDPTSAGPREFRLAREAGFVTAVTTRPGHVFPVHAAHLHALPRVSVNGLFQSEAALASLLSGVPFLAFNRGRKLNVS